MALLLTRRADESIHLRLHPEANASDLLVELATKGVEIHIKEIKRRSVVTAIVAPLGVTILRSELLADRSDIHQPPRGSLGRWLRRQGKRLIKRFLRKRRKSVEMNGADSDESRR
jgi:sRNA-binding carbon storage regulator CsrA